MAKKSRIEELEELWIEAKAEVRKNQDQRNALGQEHRQLVQERKDPSTSMGRLLEIDRRLGQIKAEYDRLKTEATRISEVEMARVAEYHRQSRRLKEARRVLDVIENPPPWGLGDYSGHQVAQMQKWARETIRELA